jgi:pimeloyl-ACP methyl ester carboxylesterase
MPYFNNNGVRIYYEIEGEGPPVVVIHGFSGSLVDSWKDTNLIESLEDNYQLILLDCRGHGKSDKPHEVSAYGHKMVDDMIKLIDHLSIEKANLFGYSMGASIIYHLLLTKPEIVISAILGGFVLNLNEKEILKGIENTKYIVDGLRAESVDQIKKPIARAFRRVAESRDNDLLALAAVQAGHLKDYSDMMTPAQIRSSLKSINVPVMTVVGSSEILLGDKTLVAQLVPNACHFQIQGKDHLTATSDPKFHMILKAFLDYVNCQ